jgi:hypothetical protein
VTGGAAARNGKNIESAPIMDSKIWAQERRGI